jgi:hypothetical protein
MLERTDPEATNPFTAISAGTLKGLEVHDAIKEQQRKEGTRSRLADISTDQPTAAYAGQVGRTLASSGDVTGALGAFQVQSRLSPTPPKRRALRTVTAGQGIYDPETGRTTTPIPAEPVKPKVYNVGGRLYRYDPETDRADPITKREPDAFTLGTGAIRYERTPEGGVREVQRGRGPTPKTYRPTDVPVRESKLRNTIESIISKRFGRPPQEFTSSGYRDRGYITKKREYDNVTESLRDKLLVQYGLAKQEDFMPEPEDIHGPPLPKTGHARVVVPSEHKADFDIIRANPNNAGLSDQELLDALTGR